MHTRSIVLLYYYTAPPGRPHSLTVDSELISYSWVLIQWQAPNNLGSHGISYYNVTVYNVTLHNNMDTLTLMSELSTEGNETLMNITDLQPGMLIQIQVAGISRVGNLIAQGPISDSFQFNTSVLSIAGKPWIILTY